MRAIHQKGTRTISMNPNSPISVTTLAARSSALRAQQIAADEYDPDHEERDQEEGDRHPAAPPKLAEGDLVGVGGEDLCRRAGAAPGHDVDDVEVVDRQDGAQKGRDDHDVLESRQRDVPEAAPGAGAVHRGRLVE